MSRRQCQRSPALILTRVPRQLKILATALFSALLLDKTIFTRKWVALVLLVVGTSISQLDSGLGGNVSLLGCRTPHAASSQLARLRQFHCMQGLARRLAQSEPLDLQA